MMLRHRSCTHTSGESGLPGNALVLSISTTFIHVLRYFISLLQVYFSVHYNHPILLFRFTLFWTASNYMHCYLNPSRDKDGFLCSLWDWYSYFEKATTKPCALAGHPAFSGAVAGGLSAFGLCFEIGLFACTKLFAGSGQRWLSLGTSTN